MSNVQRRLHPSLLLGSTIEGGYPVTLTGTDFERHKWIQGISGSGKSTFLVWVALSLLRQRKAFCLIDPHGDTARLLLSLLASSDYFKSPHAFERLWFVDFARSDAAIPFNVLKQPYDSHTVANNLLEAMHRAFPTTGTTANLDNVLLASLYVLAEHGRPITDLQRLLLDSFYRQHLLPRVADPLVAQFFATKFADKTNAQLIDSTLRRSFLLTFSPSLRNALGHNENTLNVRHLMDHQISCVVSLGGLDDQSKRLLGCLLMVGLEQAFLSRATLAPDRRPPYHVIVDEFPLFSASGDSFSIILEQVRKYAGTLYLANQTYSQLSKSLVGSLQNAIPLIMKAGTDDSAALAARFFRPIQEQPGVFDFLGLSKKTPSVFATTKNTQEAKLVFETLNRQEALVPLGQDVIKIRTPTLPSTQDGRLLQHIEAVYATRLLVPIRKEPEPSRPALVLVSPAVSTVSRRVRVPASDATEPITLVTGILDTDILLGLYHFHYMTLTQLVKLMHKESSSNYVREKINKGVADGVIDKVSLPRSSAGKSPIVYFLTTKGQKRVAETFGLPVPLSPGARKHQFLEHTLDCNEVLLAAVQVPHIENALTLHDLKHERTLKATPIKLTATCVVIPDGFVQFRTNKHEAIGLCLEIDRNTENKERIQQKIANYLSIAQGAYQQSFGLRSLTVAFCITTGESSRLRTLLQWAKEVIRKTRNENELFLFGTCSVETITPDLFLTPVFETVDGIPHALIEKPL